MSDTSISTSLAVQTFISRKSRVSHPNGSFDKKQRWYPSAEEKQSCCDGIRSPSAAYPYSLMLHCRTIEHVANLYGIELKGLKGAIKQANNDVCYYKTVAIVEERYYSIFDGTTQYCLGIELAQVAKTGHNGGYYVYETLLEAKMPTLPDRAKLLNAPRAILKVRCSGRKIRYQNKLAFSRITPIELVELL